MHRLDIIEEKMNKAPVLNTLAKTDKKTAFQALKYDWVPAIMEKLSLIYTEVQNMVEDK